MKAAPAFMAVLAPLCCAAAPGPGQPQVGLSAAQIAFADQLVGTTGAPELEVVTNTGDGPLVITGVAATGPSRADFIVEPGPLPVTLAPGDSRTVRVTFAPAAPWTPRTRRARLRLDDNAPQAPQWATLSGRGVTCAGPVPACAASGLCADTDGDGLNDAWEDAGWVDLDNDGAYTPGLDYAFPQRRPFLFSPVTHTGSGQGQVFPTVRDATAVVAPTAVAVTIADPGTVGTATFTYSIDGGPDVGPLTVRPVVDLSGNLRLMFYLSPFVSGDRYTFTATTGAPTSTADRERPNIFVRYDYMGFDGPGGVCATDAECVQAGADPNAVCRAGACTHDHAPGDPLFRKVVDQFARHGITLDIDPGHRALPHAQVVTWSTPGDGTPGATAACAGYDVVQGDIRSGGAVSFRDLKRRPRSPFTAQAFAQAVDHYAVLGHFSTCLNDTGGPGDCAQCPDDRAAPPGRPRSGASGTSEIPGNDFIVSLGERWFTSKIARTPFDEQGLFMHELGHNLGLHHDGDQANHDLAPNYLSVMNNKYVFTGIQHAAVPGDTAPVESLREVDYSEHALATLAEPHLDEQAGVSPLSSGYTGIVRFFGFSGGNVAGPEAGPVNWDGLPPRACATPADCACGAACPSLTGDCLASGACEVRSDLNRQLGITETLEGYADWDHGACATSADCRINAVRAYIQSTDDPTLDPHEPCVRGRCQSLTYPFQCFKWGRVD